MIALDELERPELPDEVPPCKVEAVPVWVDLAVVVTGMTVEEVLAEVMVLPLETMVVRVTTAWVREVVPTLVSVVVSTGSDEEDSEVVDGGTVVVEGGMDVVLVMVDWSALLVVDVRSSDVVVGVSLVTDGVVEDEAPVESDL